MTESLHAELQANIAQLEDRIHANLEEPEGIHTGMYYQIQAPGYTIRLESNSWNEVANRGDERSNIGMFMVAKRNPYITRFSCIYDSLQSRLHGTYALEQEDMEVIYMAAMPEERAFFKCAKEVYDFVPHFITPEERKIGYDLSLSETACPPEVDQWIRETSGLLSRGCLYEHRSIKRGDIRMEASTVSGPLEHLDPRVATKPVVRISVVENGSEYVFERLRKGSVEIKSYSTSDVERFKDFRTFQPSFSEDGRLLGYEISEEEIQYREDLQRHQGLFEPTPDGVHFFLSRLNAG